MDNKVMYFEIHSTDLEKSIKFYTESFGWEFKENEFGNEPYYAVTTGKEETFGIDGGLMKSPDGVARIVNVIDVPNVDEYIAKVVAAGATIVAPKTAVPGMGWCAYFTDATGVYMGVFETYSSAE